MVMGLTGDLQEGDEVDFTLTFSGDCVKQVLPLRFGLQWTRRSDVSVLAARTMISWGIDAFADVPSSQAAPPTADGAFVAWADGAARGVCIGGERCQKRYPAASTFKVPHVLLALDYQVLTGLDHAMGWDGVERSVAAWDRDHTLQTAIRASTVWYFRRLAPMIGERRIL